MVKDTDTVYSYTGAYLFLRPRAHVSLDDGFPTTRGKLYDGGMYMVSGELGPRIGIFTVGMLIFWQSYCRVLGPI